MPVFTSSDQLYAVMETLFTRVSEKTPDAAKKISDSRLILRLRTTSPVTEVVFNGRKTPIQILFGASALRPDVELEIQADLLHQVLLGKANLGKAASNGKIKMRGPIWKTFALEGVFRAGQLEYPQVLQEHDIIIQ